jgi:hypothetical protein
MRKRIFLASLIAMGAGSFAQTLPDESPAALWRAASRLGYGPTPSLMQAAQSSAKEWSWAQMNAARQASQHPAQLSTMTQIPASNQQQVSARFHEQRRSRSRGFGS